MSVPPQKVSLGYLVSHPIQYQAPLFRRLAQSQCLGFKAVYGCDFGLTETHDRDFGQKVDFGVDLTGGFEHRFVTRPRVPRVDGFFALRLPIIRQIGALDDCDAVILHGWRTAMLWQAAVQCKMQGKPYYVRAEAPLLGTQQKRTFAKRLVWNALVGRFVRSAAGVLAVGSANERFYRMLGVQAHKIHRVPYFVDNDAVAFAAAEGRRKRSEMRAVYGIPNDAFVVIAVGKLIARKRPHDLIACLAGLPERVHLVWVGTGELKSQVEKDAERLGVSRRAHFVGFRSSNKVWEIMGMSDIFAHPAEAETWGLVINEALAAGLPLLVSDDSGAAEDLVTDDAIGRILQVGDLESWKRELNRRCALGARSQMGRSIATDTLAEFSMETAARRIEELVLQRMPRS